MLVVWSLLELVDLLPFVMPKILLNGIEGLERNEKDSLWVSVYIFLHLGNALFHPHEYDIVKYVSEDSQWKYSVRNNSVIAYEIKTLLGRLLFVVQDRPGILSRAQFMIPTTHG